MNAALTRRGLVLGLLAWPATAGATPARRAYLKVHRAWTRELLLYWEGHTALVLRATLLEPAFREVLAEERRRLLGADDAGHAAFRERMQRDGERFVEFVFAADSGYPTAERFGPGDDRWNLACAADGADQALSAVDRVRDPSPLHVALYPQTDVWSKLWIARFERTVPAPRRIELRIGGGFGHGVCSWELG